MLERIKKIIVQYVEIDPDKLTPELTFKADLGLTSLATMNILVDIEDEFGVEVDEDSAMKLETLQDLLDYLSAHGVQ